MQMFLQRMAFAASVSHPAPKVNIFQLILPACLSHLNDKVKDMTL